MRLVGLRMKDLEKQRTCRQGGMQKGGEGTQGQLLCPGSGQGSIRQQSCVPHLQFFPSALPTCAARPNSRVPPPRSLP